MVEVEKEISCQNLWKVFGPDPDSVFGLVNDGVTKQEILERTGHVVAIKNVSFEIYKNEIFVVMGLSGSGKSTLIRCINQLIEPTRGTILIQGTDLAQMSGQSLKELRRQKLSMVFQHFGLLPHRSVADNVAFGLEIRGESGKDREAEVNHALELVGLRGWEKSRIHELSGGMQQRVGLARALAVDTDILLMDEPFSALDPLIRRQMQDEFINMRTTVKKTVVFITHDLLEALKLGDRVAVMKDGEIVQIGTPQEIVLRPANNYVSEFVKDVPRGQIIPVKDIMEQPTVLVGSEENLEAAIKQMKKEEITVAFVIDADSRLKGIVTMEQAEESAKKGVTQIKEIIQIDVASISANTRLDDCLSLVTENDIPLAILSEEKHLLGVVTRSALIKAMQLGSGNNN
ncbi:MAG: glycine betaine/L-proline ABC transporter ATP-binding protein [Dehalococcoidales bacterium]|jgi:glycine betaine/proline transport system ATP-binding protein|nr:glycine betaine/L-proline ABC transporter ATP-binding protein [Dehalococcoidales bacterium]